MFWKKNSISLIINIISNNEVETMIIYISFCELKMFLLSTLRKNLSIVEILKS